MKRYSILISIVFIIPVKMQAQTNTIIGEYYLKNTIEMAAGFNFKPDTSFEFFLSYGVLDRYGKGKWSVKNNILILNSNPAPLKNFTLVKSGVVVDNELITIKITDANKALLPYINVVLYNNNNKGEAITNEEGIASFPKQAFDSIGLIFQLCPERKSFFTVSKPSGNYFQFSIEPWLMEVFFENINLQIKGHRLSGLLPFINDKECLFEKEQ